MKTAQGYLLFLVLGIISLMLPGKVRAAGETTNLDVAMVLDISGSMRTTDPKRISFEGSKLFVDMMESLNSRAGFAAFDTEVRTQYDLKAMDSAADKTDIKKAIDALAYTRGDTNIGTALDSAVRMLEKAEDTGNKKMVLFFTDGDIDLDNRPDVESEQEKKSLEDARAAAKRAAEEGIGIYTIGLNAGKSEKYQMDPALITEVAETTDAICRVVTSADELPGAFNDIFAHIIDSEIDDLGEVTISEEDTYEEKVINIPNESVLEANIVLFNGDSDQLEDIQLVDPDAQVIEPDDENMFHTSSDAYEMLKIIAPDAGDWVLKLKGSVGSKVHVNLIFNYDITMETDAEQDDAADAVHVSARLLKKGLVLTDDAIYAQMTAVVNVEKSDGSTDVLPMNQDEKHNYLCDVPLKDQEAVTLQVHIEGANMYRDSEKMEFSRISEEPETTEVQGQTAELSDEESAGTRSLEEEPAFTVKAKSIDSPLVLKGLFPGMGKVSLDLNEFFETDDPDAAGLTYQVKLDKPEVVDAVVNGNTLELTGKEKGSARMTILAEDSNGETYELGTEVQVSALVGSLPVLIIICAAALCLLIILVMLILKKRNE